MTPFGRVMAVLFGILSDPEGKFIVNVLFKLLAELEQDKYREARETGRFLLGAIRSLLQENELDLIGSPGQLLRYEELKYQQGLNTPVDIVMLDGLADPEQTVRVVVPGLRSGARQLTPVQVELAERVC